jgi:hypothetical protein
MPRIRTIKPEFWADEKIGPLEPITRLVFLGLISQADDAGRLVDSVRQLDGLLFPYTDDTCAESLDILARLSRISRYRSESGQRLIQIENWSQHQKVDNPSKYVLPGPSLEVVAGDRDSDSSRDPREILARSSLSDLGPTTYDHGPRSSSAGATFKDPWDGLDTIVSASIRGLYGGEGRTGTDEAVWKAGNGIDRERALATALLRWRGEGHTEFRSRLFRRILESVIEEQSHSLTDSTEPIQW